MSGSNGAVVRYGIEPGAGAELINAWFQELLG